MNRRCWSRSGLVVLALLVATATGCGPGDTGGTAQENAPRRGGTVTIASEADPDTFNPVRMASAQAARLFAVMQPGLFELDPETGAWRQGLATSWSFEADSTVVVLRLDTELNWSDGETFGARDVAATFDLYLDETVAYPRRSRLAPIESYQVLDAGTLRVVFREKVADPLLALAHDVLPAHVIDGLDRTDPAGWPIGRAPVTLGPYRLADWVTNERLSLERNPFHPRPGNLDAIRVTVVPDAATRTLQLGTGEVDLVPSVALTQVSTLERDPEVTVVAVPGRSVSYLQYDLRDPILADVRVRRAISLAVDRQGMVDGVLFGYGRPAATLLPPVSWAHDTTLAPHTRDIEAARALMAGAGHTEPVELTLHLVAGDPVREAVASTLRAQLAEIGIELTLRPLEMGALMRVARTEPFQILHLQLAGPVDADLRPFLATGAPFNFGQYANATFDAAVAAATSAPDRELAREHARTLQVIVFEEQPVTPLYFVDTIVAHRVRLHGVEPTWLSPFAGIAGWWVEDAVQ